MSVLRRVPTAIRPRAHLPARPIAPISARATTLTAAPSHSSIRIQQRPAASVAASKSTAASPAAPTSTSPSSRVGRDGDNFWLTPEQIARYHSRGYMALSGFLTEEDLRPLEVVYDRFMSREIPVPGKDFCDMSAEFDVPFDQWNLINAMLPTKYHPELQNNIYERRAAHVCQQLFDVPMGLDYDQLLAKKPSKKAAVFAWHCDMAYWPPVPDTRTATFSLALDATTRANGCLRFVPGSHVSQTIRAHKPLHEDRTKAHAIACQVGKDEEVTYEEIPRGGVTIHNEYIVHGSGGNTTTGWRRTYVAAFRTKETIELERRAGFTHSHNDEVNWDTFNHWDK